MTFGSGAAAAHAVQQHDVLATRRWRSERARSRARWTCVLALVACGAPPRTEPSPRPPPVAAPAPGLGLAIADLLAPSIAAPIIDIRRGTRTRPIEAPHARTIEVLAVTPEGDAVISGDELGGVRLWPALDGSVEPRIVDLPHPRALAIGRAPGGFTIAMLDAVGALGLAAIDADGLIATRFALPVEPAAYAGLAGVTRRGVIAWRADQRVVRVAADATVATLAADAGQRIVTIAIAGERAVAVLDGERGPRARWLELGDTLAWGRWIETPLPPSPVIAISPSGTVLATLTSTATRPTAIVASDTATGALLVHESVSAAQAIAVPSDDHLAFATFGGISWITRAKLAPPQPAQPATVTRPIPTRPILGTGAGGTAIAAVRSELSLAEPNRQPEFLGYERTSPSGLATAAPGGRVLVKLPPSHALLDAELRERPAPDLGIDVRHTLVDARWLAGDEWLVHAVRGSDGKAQLSIRNVATGKARAIATDPRAVQPIAYAPATGLLAIARGDAAELLRHIPGALRVARVARAPRSKGAGQTTLHPVDPARAGGAQLVVAEAGPRLTLRWVANPARLAAGAALVVDGTLAAVATTGHVLVWEIATPGQMRLAVYRDGRRIGSLPVETPTGVALDPRGTQLVQLTARSIALVDLDGTQRWARPLQGISQAVWLDDGALVLVGAGGVARVDAASGEVTAARCGWRFERSTRQHPVAGFVEPLCAQLR